MSWSHLIVWGIGLSMGYLAGWRSRQLAVTQPAPEEVKTAASSEQLEQTKLAYQMATAMSQFKGSFLAQTSHELRSPLNSVISLHQLILADLCDSPAEEREFVAQAHTAALRMLKLLDEIIQISKVEHGTSVLQIQPVQLAALLQEVQQLTYLQAQNRSLRLEIDRPDPSVYVLADPRWLQQVLVSLVTTSIALMQEGTIRLTTRILANARQAQILIEDQHPISIWSQGNLSPEVGSSAIEQSVEIQPIQASLPSPQFTLMLNQTLMGLMKGQLEVVESQTPQTTALETSTSSRSVSTVPSGFTQICCSIPLAQTESEPFNS